MIANIIISSWSIFALLFIAMLIYHSHNKSIQYLLFQNYLKVGIPYVTLNVQGHLLNMIVDSGAAVSVITKEALDLVTYESSSRNVEVIATTSESVPSDMVTIPIIINDKELREDFIVHDVPDLANFKSLHGIVAHGIIGNEFLDKTYCKIDYKKHSVTLY